MGREKDFTEKTKLKCLLWSDRHCCICGKSRGLDIEVHHVEANGGNHIDNAIPVCYDCHARLGRYIDGQPRGNKYRIEEIKKRRDQIYERYTSHLIPGIVASAHPLRNERGIKFPKVGFSITPSGRFIPVKAKLWIRIFLGKKDLGEVTNAERPYYCGGIRWNLNPGVTFLGNFVVPDECVDSNKGVKLEMRMTILDPYEREHELLPRCFNYVRPKKEEPKEEGWWFLEPTSFCELKRYMKD